MKRREFIAAIGCAAVWPLAARAQHSGRIPAVGILWQYADAEVAAPSRLPLLKGLAELGYIPGKTFILEERYANEVPERYDALATELVNVKVDVLASAGGSSILALHRATSIIPTVFVGVNDPVTIHLVSSFSKPGGNLSGLTNMAIDSSKKRLLLLQQAIPTVSQVALLRDPTNVGAPFKSPPSLKMPFSTPFEIGSCGSKAPTLATTSMMCGPASRSTTKPVRRSPNRTSFMNKLHFVLLLRG